MKPISRFGLWCGAVSFAGVAALAAGCSTTPPPVSTHNLERPSDMVFACVGLLNAAAVDGGTAAAGGADGGTTTPVVSGRPMYECNAPGRFDPPPDVTRRTFAFIANSARGELSVLDLDNSKLIDLDLANPETNVAPLGVQPEQISASSDGCRVVSANRGSCDLTLVDVGTLMSQTLAAEGKANVASTARSTVSQEIVVRGGTTGAPLRVSPQEIMFLPQDTSAITGSQNLCARTRPFADPIGWNATPTQPVETQWKAVVTFPTCNLVALIDLPSGNIVDSVKVATGSDGVSVVLQPAGSDPVCPVQDFCDGHGPSTSAAPSGGVDGGADGGASDAGPSTPGAGAAVSSDPYVNPNGVRPSSLAILPGGGRAYVGLAQASFVVAVDVQPNHLAVPASGGSILLHEGALGVDGVRLSVDPYQATGIPGQLGGFVGEGDQRQRQYLYAIARDGTVRVVDVSRSSRLIPESECDVNVDPKFIPIASADPSIPDRSHVCWPTDPPDLLHRRPLARGPGIRLPSIPRDVAFANFKLGDNREAVLDGSYGFILTSNGAVYEVNIDPTLRINTETSAQATPAPLPEVQPLVNSLRDQNMLTFNANMDPTTGPARVDLAPVPPTQGPQLEGINTTSPDDNATDTTGATVQTYVFFPQQVCTRSTANPVTTCAATAAPNNPPMIDPQRQTWNITWEGDLFGPTFSGQFAVDRNNVTTLKDAGVDFCQAGALPGDFVTLFGCTVDTQCGPLQVCRRSPTAPDTAGTLLVNGLCVRNDPLLEQNQLNDCGQLLNSVRRYEITSAISPPGGSSVLTLRPKIDEVISVSFSTAESSPGGCAKLNDPCGPASDPTRASFSCQYVDDTTHLRCVQACGGTDDSNKGECRAGRSCESFDNAPTGQKRFCADAPTLTQDLVTKCNLNQLTAYKVGVGSSFLVQGTAPQPFVPAQVNPTTFSCEPNPARLDRIPYFQTVNGVRTVMPSCPQLPDDSGDLETQLLAQVHTAPDPNPCVIKLGMSVGPQPLRALFQNREVRFVLLNLDSYLGDQETIPFDVHGGFQPDSVVMPVDIDIDTPNRIVLGPVDSQTQLADLSTTHELPYLYVVDQRRLGRATAGVGATRGQVLRINPRRATTADANSLIPIYDDSATSNGLWPIQ